MKKSFLVDLIIVLLFFCLPSFITAQTVIQVTAGVDGISAALATATSGSIIELTDSGGEYVETTDDTITVDVTIRAAAGLAEKPVIYGGGGTATFVVTTGGLTVQGIRFDGDAHGTPFGQYAIFGEAPATINSTHFVIKADNCEFNAIQQRAFFTSAATQVAFDSVIVTNCVFTNLVKQALYLQNTRASYDGYEIFPGSYKYCLVQNCLEVGSTSGSDGHFCYLEPGDRGVGDKGWPTVIVDHVTVDKNALGISTYTTPGAVVKNCIVTNLNDPTSSAFSVETGRWTTEPLPPPSTVTNCIYFNSEGVSWGTNPIEPVVTNVVNADPIYNDPDNMDYSLKDGSPGKNGATDGLDIGYISSGINPPPAGEVIQVEAGVDGIATAVASAPAGSIIELTSSGGEYIEQNDVIITKNLTVRAAAGLEQKPVIYCGGSETFYITGGGFNISGVKFDGLAHGTPFGAYFIYVKLDTGVVSSDLNLRVDNCEFDNAQQRAISNSDGSATVMDSIIIKNSIFRSPYKQGIYLKGTYDGGFPPGACYNFKVENCLFIGGETVAAGDGHAMYLETFDKTADVGNPNIFVNHVTCDNWYDGGIINYGISGAVVQNCIATNMTNPGGAYGIRVESGRYDGALPTTLKNSIYWNTAGDTTTQLFPGNAYSTPIVENVVYEDPMYADPANEDYSLQAGSPGKSAGTDGLDIGYISGGFTDVQQIDNRLPESFQLSQNYPNPFNPTTTIQFSIPKSGVYSIKVYNLLGQEIAELFNDNVSPGVYQVNFNAAELSSGIYFYTLSGNNINVTKKMMLIK